MSWTRQFDQSKILFLFALAVLVLLLITYFAFHRAPEKTVHLLPQVQTNDFESVVLKSETPVLVDFYADWCPPCRQMEPILVEISRENPRVKVVQVNVDENAELAGRFNINSIPTFMVFKKGEVTAQLRGKVEKSTLQSLMSE
jgi:thioredoxin 1